jgi:hypothetical protein
MSLIIATPCYGGLVHAKTAMGVLASITSGQASAWLTCEGESLVPRARNTIVATFLKSSRAEWLLWIDGDIVFEPAHVEALRTRAEWRGWKILAGVYCMKRPKGGPIYLDPIDPTDGVDPADGGCFAVRAAGTGCLLVHRSVYEGDAGLPRTALYADWHPCGVVDGLYESEDWGFCRLARERGHRIMVDPSVKVGHLGGTEWREGVAH